MGQRLLGCEAPQDQAVADQGRAMPPAACFPQGHTGKEFITAPKPKSSLAVVPTTTPQPSTALGCPASARPTLGDTDTWSQVATRARSSEAHPGPSPTLKQRQCCTVATIPVGTPAPTSVTQRCSGCLEWWRAHKHGTALCRNGSCICSPKRTGTRVSSPCTVSF